MGRARKLRRHRSYCLSGTSVSLECVWREQASWSADDDRDNDEGSELLEASVAASVAAAGRRPAALTSVTAMSSNNRALRAKVRSMAAAMAAANQEIQGLQGSLAKSRETQQGLRLRTNALQSTKTAQAQQLSELRSAKQKADAELAKKAGLVVEAEQAIRLLTAVRGGLLQENRLLDEKCTQLTADVQQLLAQPPQPPELPAEAAAAAAAKGTEEALASMEEYWRGQVEQAMAVASETAAELAESQVITPPPPLSWRPRRPFCCARQVR